MRKKDTKTPKHPDLLESMQADVEYLWCEGEKRLMQALDDSEKKTITLNFSVTLDMSENAPVFDSRLSFKDKDTEAGMDVTKTYSIKRRTKFEDPNQPLLPGADPNEGGEGAPAGEPGAEDKPKRGKKGRKKSGKEAAAGDSGE